MIRTIEYRVTVETFDDLEIPNMAQAQMDEVAEVLKDYLYDANETVHRVRTEAFESSSANGIAGRLMSHSGYKDL